MAFLPHLLIFTLIINILIFQGNSEVIYEDGYTVTTVFDGNKVKINPHSVVPRTTIHDLLLLDSSNSVFYTLSLPLSQESLVKKFSGNGMPEYSDGVASSAMFNKPRSFTVDYRGNVYVADRSNRVIRKISHSGVTTIAGDHSNSPGRDDGPGQNATFSADYELSFVPEICALLIMDHGNKLIRQINLKQDDCVHPQSGGVGSTSVWIAALVVSCLVGLFVGFAARPYIVRTEVFKLLNSKSWTTYLMNLGKQAQMHYLGNRSAAVSAAFQFLTQLTMLFLSHLSLMFNFRPNRTNSCSSSVPRDCISLLDSDNSRNSEDVLYLKYADQLKELTTSTGDLGSYNMINSIVEHEDMVETDEHCNGKIDTLMKDNLESFGEVAPDVFNDSFLGVSTVIKRR